MSPPIPQGYDHRDCPTPQKRKYLDAAGALAGSLRRVTQAPDEGRHVLSVYHCCRPPRRSHGCGFWHLTSGKATRCLCLDGANANESDPDLTPR